MRADFYPFQMLLFTVSGWVNRHQQDVIAYLVEENRVLKEQLTGRKLLLTDEQRRRLAAEAKRLGRQALNRVATLVTPDTLMRWHRRLIALKWTYEARRVGRPGLMRAIAGLIVRMAQENSGWAYCQIEGELKDLGHRVAPSTIAKVLKEKGIQPAPDRLSSWRSFLEAHWGEVAGTDLFTTEVWTARGLVTYYVLFVIDLRTRQVHFAGATPNPDESFMAQVARNLTDGVDGFLAGHRFLICDRDAKFTARFRQLLEDAGVQVIRTPRQAPNCNAHAERFVLSIKSECLTQDDLLQRVVFASGGPRVPSALPHRAQPPRDRQRGHSLRRSGRRWRGPLPRAVGWPPEALLPGGVTMEMLNRSAVIVKPRQPYLAWARRDAEGLAESVLEALSADPHVYLQPEYEDPATQQEVLEEFWPGLFDSMLEGWVTDEAYWPKNRTFEMFREWFEVQMSSIVQDLYLDEPLEYFE